MVRIEFPTRNISRQTANCVASIARKLCGLGINVLIGFVIGFLLSTVFRCGVAPYSGKYCAMLISGNSSNRYASLLLGRSCQGQYPSSRVDSPLAASAEKRKFYTDKNQVLVAVMTAKEFLKTRVVAVHDTWAKSIPGEVIFFSSEGSEKESPPGIKVIGLKGVRDVYPPQKKAFMMLKYIHDHYLDKFRFFIRADDDIYIKGEELLKFLHSINSSRVSAIGQTGLGNKEEFGKLYLRGAEDNFCMGGPGVIFSKEILAKTVPHIKYCLKNLYSTHEDVEVGRCIKQFANATCTWSYQTIFYQNYDEPKGSFTHSLCTRDIQKAITLHPVKIPTYAYRLHQYVLDLKTASLRNRLQSLKQEIDVMNHLLKNDDADKTSFARNKVVSVNDAIRRTTDDIVEWDFTVDQLYSSQDDNPKQFLQTDKRIGRQEDYDEILSTVDKQLQTIEYSFFRKHPMHGQERVTGIKTEHRKPTNSKLTMNTVEHVFTRRPFVELEFREDIRSSYIESSNPTESEETILAEASAERVNFILSLAGRYSIFLKFMQNFEDVFLKTNENVSLTIMLFRNDPNDTSVDVMNYVTRLKQKYNDSSLSVVLMNGNFSRGVALQNGSRRFQGGDLLFFADVDLELQSSTLLRIRLNTVKGQTIYAPIFFVQYDPQYLSPNVLNENLQDAASTFELDRGYWHRYSFGMISAYKSDLDRTGGFRQDIKGWGLEDVDLFDKFLSANVTVFRSVDVGLLHRFHPIICDRTLEKKQYDQCIGMIATTVTSTRKMADIVYRTPEIFNRDKKL